MEGHTEGKASFKTRARIGTASGCLLPRQRRTVKMDFDYMLTRVGEFGKYQKLLFLFQAPFAVFVTFVLFGQIFITTYPEVFWCGALGFPDALGGLRPARDCHNLTDLQRARLTSPMDNMCVRYDVRRSEFQEFIGQMNRACNTSGECVRQVPRSGRVERQAPAGYRPWLGGSNTRAPVSTDYYSSRQPPTTTRSSTGTRRSSTTQEPRTTTPMPSRSLGAFDDNGFLSCNSTRSEIVRLAMNPEVGLNTSTLQWPRRLPCGQTWFHNTTQFNFNTIVTQAGYWCDIFPNLDVEWKVTIAQSVFYIGAIVGGVLIGYVADNYGRVPALVAANVCGCVGGVLSVVTTNFWAFCFFRFIAGLSFDNCFTMIYILVIEYVGPSYRTLVANLSIALFYTFGSVMVPLLFWLIRDWRWFGLVISLPMLLAILAHFIVPESARWLLSKGRIKDATNILRDFAKKNGEHVEEETFIEFEKVAEEAYAEFKKEEEVGLLDALKRPRILKNFILLVLIWSLIALIYDGHSRNVLNLGSNPLVMFAIANSLELPADLLLVFILDVIGRRWLAFASLSAAAIFSLVSAAPPIASDGTILLIFALVSRFFVNIAFNIGLQYAAEVLPTIVRAQGVNFIHIMGYVFAIVSPFVAAIGRTNPSLSLTILGLCALIAAVLCLFLPETLGEDLPNTLEDGESFGSKQSFWNCPVCSGPLEPDEKVPIAQPPDAVRQRNSLRASLRGEALRSSMLYHSPAQLRRLGSRRAGATAENVKLRRVYTR